MLRVEREQLLHAGEGVSLLDVEAAPGALADSEVADLAVVAHCGEAQVEGNSTRAEIRPSPPPCWLHPLAFEDSKHCNEVKATQLSPGLLHPTPHLPFAPSSWPRGLLAIVSQAPLDHRGDALLSGIINKLYCQA